MTIQLVIFVQAVQGRYLDLWLETYGNRDCQASKGFDKHIQDDNASFVDTQIYI